MNEAPTAARPPALSSQPSGRLIMRALRPHQWAKNLLVAVPLLLAHEVRDPGGLLAVALAFAAFSLCASGTYVVNDLLDRDRDRLHPEKRHRPFASGALAPGVGYALAPLCVGGAFALALATLPLEFAAVLALYTAATLAYSLRLKRVAGLDVVLLAGLYALRVLGGAAATGVAASEWLLAFSLFFFLDLALLKRYAELRLLETDVQARDNGRGYRVDDIAMIRGFGPATGFLAILVLALYITSPDVSHLYAHPARLWLVAPPLLYWTMRMWLAAHRGQMPGDPVLHTLRDPASWAVGAGVAGALLAATL